MERGWNPLRLGLEFSFSVCCLCCFECCQLVDYIVCVFSETISTSVISILVSVGSGWIGKIVATNYFFDLLNRTD